MKNPIGWFEIPVLDMDRAKTFYEAVFGIEITVNDFAPGLQMGWFPFDHQAPGATGSLVKNENYTPSHNGTLIYFSVEEIEDIEPKINSSGGTVLNPKYSIGEHGFCSIFEDSEGNRVALHQGIGA